jgi:hypothetical protein
MKNKARIEPLPDASGNLTPHFQTMITSTLDPNNYYCTIPGYEIQPVRTDSKLPADL